MGLKNDIVLRNVNHYYKKVHTIRDFSFEFEKDTITVIAGRSGSGKSTLLKIINGLISPASGEVIAFGTRVIKNDITVRHRIGYVIQNIGLFPHIDVRENIEISGRIINSRVDAGRTDELLSMVSLPLQVMEKYPHELSGGEQQRVGLCRALYLDPPVLLLDEPMSSLDSITRRELLDQILQLQHNSRRTILFVTHDLRDALHLEAQILVMDGGSLMQYGPIADVIQNPEGDVVKDLVKASRV